MPSICIDLDNVIAKTDEVMREIIHQISAEDVDLKYEDVVCFEYWKCRDRRGRRISRAEWNNVHQEFTRNHLMRIQPFKNINKHLELIVQRF